MKSLRSRVNEAKLNLGYTRVEAIGAEAARLITPDDPEPFSRLLASPALPTTVLRFSVEELVEVLRDPDIRFTTTPENTHKYAEFMREIGSIENQPASWRDLFFPEIHATPGS